MLEMFLKQSGDQARTLVGLLAYVHYSGYKRKTFWPLILIQFKFSSLNANPLPPLLLFVYSKVGSPQISSANGKSANLWTNFFYVFRTFQKMWHFAEFGDHIVFVDEI